MTNPSWTLIALTLTSRDFLILWKEAAPYLYRQGEAQLAMSEQCPGGSPSVALDGAQALHDARVGIDHAIFKIRFR